MPSHAYVPKKKKINTIVHVTDHRIRADGTSRTKSVVAPPKEPTPSPDPPSRSRSSTPTARRTPRPDTDQSADPPPPSFFHQIDDEDLSHLYSSQGKSSTDFMHDWMLRRTKYLQAIISTENMNGLSTPKCSTCGAAAWYRCKDCYSTLNYCAHCCRVAHGASPLHRLHRWTGTSFQRSMACQEELGIVLYFGHQGKPCPMYQEEHYRDCAPHPNTPHGFSPLSVDLAASQGAEQGSGGPADEPSNEDESFFSHTNPEAAHFIYRKSHDSSLNPLLCVVHTNGIHYVRARFCVCSDAPPSDIQVLSAGLYPSTQIKVETVFSQAVLNEFLLAKLECHVTANSFYSMLRRQTSPAFPDILPDRYRELLRCSRQWSWLKLQKWSGAAFDDAEGQSPAPGGLVSFCAACPQPGKNLPQEWQREPDQWRFQIRLIQDGNFKAEHLLYKSLGSDVRLSDGQGFMVTSAPFRSHVNATQHMPVPVSTCQEHRAVNNTSLARKNLASSGIGAVACVRHGCFVPHSVVDFQKGERQSHMDYAFVNAVMYFKGTLLTVMLFYDVACQYYKNFHSRMKSYADLSLPFGTAILWLIGMFHIHGHQDACFVRHAPTFMTGAADIDGEIIETLWVTLNDASGSHRSMGTAHRQESIDMLMNDSNWKKLIRMMISLRRKHRKAVEGSLEHGEAVATMIAGSTVVRDNSEAWDLQATKAVQAREEDMKYIDEMKIFDMDKKTVPTQKEIRLRLTQDERGDDVGHADWLVQGLQIQDQQLAVQKIVRDLGLHPTLDALTALAAKRNRLQNLVDKFQQSSLQFLPDDIDISLAQPISVDAEWDVIDDLDGNTAANVARRDQSDYPEHQIINLPSSLSSIPPFPELKVLQKKELDLRIAQAYDALNELRLNIAHRSFLYRTAVRLASSYGANTRARQLIQGVSNAVAKAARQYCQAFEAIQLLQRGTPDERCDIFRKLDKSDLKSDTTALEFNARGTRHSKLSWIWSVDKGSESPAEMLEVTRVNYLRAQARKARWEEEQSMVSSEIEWVGLFFNTQSKLWHERGEKGLGPGFQEYARRKSDMWRSFQIMAERTARLMKDDAASIKTRYAAEHPPLQAVDERDEDDV
ncbi:hypothetical protein BXZ70DRAFT_1011599 [Cristinia sonorae]|uniref:CxC2-like cysteine cluster KDZ transposase-associated domain-containing protein n=1 Tax=Cristinia sonorae TaxID=1940300 RepID=A0A8K0UFW7_9AGAR|nr:hypothetical protein BXZ70DRAFT_1011599 [Cristinia sonorae]